MTIVLVLGLGEVGKPIYELMLESGMYEVYGYDVNPLKTIHKFEEIPVNIDFMHICYPYADDFNRVTLYYIDRFKPKYVIIHSTVAPGTTRVLYDVTKIPIAFSPVRGKHPKIKEHLKFWSKWVAALPKESIGVFKEHLESMGLKVRIADRPETLEIAKLWETVYRALMIAGWQEIHRVARKFNANIVEIAEFIAEVHEVLRDRPIYYPDYIGGHCLIPNTKILNKAYPSKAWQFIIESNEKRRKELGNEKVMNDIKKLKEVWREHSTKQYYN
ncbi:MAG: GDP-mannose dehydrogenase [Thermoprotei archaeon]|nr:MAG: GDP-mannose dehydrogenase [Thermoprotei archaeon]